MSKSRIGIIGGGSVGLFLGTLLNDELDVFIFEKNNRLGKKILASGNGKCNFTNKGEYDLKYNNEFANVIINKYNTDKTLQYFSEKGLMYKFDNQNRGYPLSENAESVLDVLKMGLTNTKIFLDSEVKNISIQDGKYIIETKNKNYEFEYIVCCSGSKASNLGNDKAYQYFSDIKVKINDLKPSLTPIKIKENVSSLKGVRVKCLVKLLKDNKKIYEEVGEVLFKEDGLSGIVIFNISHFINKEKGNYNIVLDLSYGLDEENFEKYITKKKDVNTVFKGLLNDKLGTYIFNLLKSYDSRSIYKQIKNLSFTYKEHYPFTDAQVCNGGVSIDEVDDNLQLIKYPNIYVGGELLDINGVCGGYNLQFAWSSAGVIADDILKKERKKYEKK